MDLAQLIYMIIMKMDMDLSSMISSQITQIAQSNSSKLGFPALITALCDVKGISSYTLTFESLSPIINLAYIQKNYWNPVDTSVVFPTQRKARAHTILDAPSSPPPIVLPLIFAPPSLLSTPLEQLIPMMTSLHQGQCLYLCIVFINSPSINKL